MADEPKEVIGDPKVCPTCGQPWHAQKKHCAKHDQTFPADQECQLCQAEGQAKGEAEGEEHAIVGDTSTGGRGRRRSGKE